MRLHELGIKKKYITNDGSQFNSGESAFIILDKNVDKKEIVD